MGGTPPGGWVFVGSEEFPPVFAEPATGPPMKRAAPFLVLTLALGCGDGDRDDGMFGDFGTDDGGTGGDGGGEGDDGGSDGDGSGDDGGGGDGDGDGGVKFDVGTTDEGDPGDCGCGNQVGFSYIWMSNSAESTVSKVHTVTMEEDGRYITRADGAGDPSRTSVSLSGKAVAVANRNGGVVKIWALPSFCDPMKNGQPGLQTSTGKNDVLAWGEDDCVEWFTPFDYTTNRPIAWAPGVLDEETCEYENETLWTAGCDDTTDGHVWVHRLDGDTGAVLDTVALGGMACDYPAAYGGASDADGNFWLTSFSGQLGFVDAQTLQTGLWTSPVGAYGMTVDNQGRPWMGGGNVAMFDPATQQFSVVMVEHNGQTGMQVDAQGRLWKTFTYHDHDTDGLIYVDTNTLQVGEAYSFADFGLGHIRAPKGVSIDLHGNVWANSYSANAAVRFDPSGLTMDSYEELNKPYTYSDMTGWALQNAACDPAG